MIRSRLIPLLFPLLWLAVATLACAQGSAPVIYVTATPQPVSFSGEPTLPNPFLPTPTPRGPTATPLRATPNPRYEPTVGPIEYEVVSGDTLSSIAVNFGTDLTQVLALNPGLNANAVLVPGQKLIMPGRPGLVTPNVKLIPDSELVNSPAASKFDVAAYIKFQPGFIRVYSENLGDRFMSGAEIIQFFATSTSVNPRLLLALLEYRGGWITNPVPPQTQMDYPMGYRNEQFKGLFRQVEWATTQLNAGYYGWKTRATTTLIFPDKSRLSYAPELNAGTIGVQNFLAQSAPDKTRWQFDISAEGFLTSYMAMFGDPFLNATEPLVPPELKQPDLTLPFAAGEVWHLTSGPHGGWDATASGWAAVDFAPPKPPDEVLIAEGTCFVSPNYATAMAPGMVVRSGNGAVVIDLDMDGDERTGWTLLYLHIADKDRIAAGTLVQAGTQIGHPSCEGFWLRSLGTHIHIARRYNGEWMVADCQACAPGVAAPPFVMSGWEVKGYPRQAYQGYLQRQGQVRRAQVGREDPTNQVSW